MNINKIINTTFKESCYLTWQISRPYYCYIYWSKRVSWTCQHYPWVERFFPTVQPYRVLLLSKIALTNLREKGFKHNFDSLDFKDCLCSLRSTYGLDVRLNDPFSFRFVIYPFGSDATNLLCLKCRLAVCALFFCPLAMMNLGMDTRSLTSAMALVYYRWEYQIHIAKIHNSFYLESWSGYQASQVPKRYKSWW